jgi:hypothetical protein
MSEHDRPRVILLLRIGVYALLVLVEIAAILYLSKGYKTGLLEHSPVVYLLPLALVMPWLMGKRLATLITENETNLKATPNLGNGLLILSLSAIIFAYVAVAIALSPGLYIVH